MNVEDLLSRSQKEDVVRSMLNRMGTGGEYTLTFDRRFGFDFEVRANGCRPAVTFSVGISDSRFGFALAECARALRDIRRSHAVAIMHDVCLSQAIRIPKKGYWLRGSTPNTVALSKPTTTALVRR